AGGRIRAIAAQLDVHKGRRLLPQAGVEGFRKDVDRLGGFPLRSEVERRAFDGTVTLKQADIGAFGGITGPHALSKGHVQAARTDGTSRGVCDANRAACYRAQRANRAPTEPAPGTGPMMVVRWPNKTWSCLVWMSL